MLNLYYTYKSSLLIQYYMKTKPYILIDYRVLFQKFVRTFDELMERDLRDCLTFANQ